MILWTDKTAAEATGGKAQGSWLASCVEIDSRKIQPGDLFVAIKGDNFDGHTFVDAALAKGAVAAVVSNVASPLEEGNFIIVPDTLKALENLGTFARSRCPAKIIGVTGSVGKTSCKEMLKIALAAHGKTYATGGNYNNHIGTPLNLANLPPDTQFGIYEMGMNHAGEISHLTRMVRPDVAIITSIEPAHLEFFDSVEDIAKAKAEIFEGTHKNGAAVLNEDSQCADYLRAQAELQGIAHIYRCGSAAGMDAHLVSYQTNAGGSKVKTSIDGKVVEYTLPVGKHWAQLSLLVLMAVRHLGLDVAKSAEQLTMYFSSEPAGRGQQVPVRINNKEVLLIDDSYNASPAAMRAAILKTAEVWKARRKHGRLLAALGDMRELGANAPMFHEQVAQLLVEQGFTKIFTAGPLMEHAHKALPQSLRGAHVQSAGELVDILKNEVQEQDVLLIKGSHGSKMYEVAQALQTTKEGKQKHAV